MANIGILFPGVGDLTGGGGAERFFSDFFQKYQKTDSSNKLFFITDKKSLRNFQTIGNLRDNKRVIKYHLFNNRFKDSLEFFQLLFFIIINRIDIIQIPLYNLHYYPLIKKIDSLPNLIRPKLVINITDCRIPYYYFNDENHGHNFKKTFEPIFENVKIDAVISWYELFKKFAIKNDLIKSEPEIYCISSRYSGKPIQYSKPKKNIIVFAARFTHVKQPLFFIKAVNILKTQKTNINDWEFKMYGKGDLDKEVLEAIKSNNLEKFITVDTTIDMTSVFEDSKCFVSTQNFENFPSLSMNEAMAAGNAIISRNVGQTNLFVKDGLNGILLKKDTPLGLANSLNWYISHPETHEKMAAESVRLTLETHNFKNFKSQMDLFWNQIIKR